MHYGVLNSWEAGAIISDKEAVLLTQAVAGQENAGPQAVPEATANPTGNESTAKWRVYTNLARDLSREVHSARHSPRTLRFCST